MKELSTDALDAFIKQNPKCFSRCFLDTQTKCDVIVNNMAETFNGTIIQARSKHIIDKLGDIRVSVMSRLTTRHTEMLNKDVVVYPRAQLKLDKQKSWAHKCRVYPSSPTMFQVSDYDDVSVDLVNKTCTCRRWDLSGIPCKHVCAVAGFIGSNSEQFVHEIYLKEQYLKSYVFTIPPLPSAKYWPSVDYPLDPPPVKAMPGRPKKNRKKDPHEDPKRPGKLTKHGVQMSCSYCKSTLHNIRRCPEKGKGKSNVEDGGDKRSMGRPKGRSTKASKKTTKDSEKSTQASKKSTQETQQLSGSKRPRVLPKGRFYQAKKKSTQASQQSTQPTQSSQPQQSTPSRRTKGSTKENVKGKAA
ncbi:uncharacterized protein LOC143610783 [Bidens hawaiensis]|uniref:uncharacterized protein LOC143610783 n=1 Tax=Bidens hawaiensis TaxID=980011 RepID=UPI0040491CBA